MPLQQFPSGAQLRPVDPVLTPIAAALVNRASNFIGTAALPPTPFGVAQKTGTIIRASVGAMFGDGSTALNRAPGADFPTGIGPSLDNISYVAQQSAYAVDVPDEQVRDSMIDVWRFKLGEAASRIAIDREAKALNLFGTFANWTGSFNVLNAWTAAGSDPMADMKTAQSSIGLFGSEPNTLVLGYSAFDALRSNAAFLSFMPNNMDRNLATITYLQSAIEDALGIPRARVFVARASRNTANQGATATLARIATNWAWMGYIELGEGTSVAIDGQTVQTAATAALRLPVQEVEVEQYRDASKRREVANVTVEEALTVVNPQLGAYIGAVA